MNYFVKSINLWICLVPTSVSQLISLYKLSVEKNSLVASVTILADCSCIFSNLYFSAWLHLSKILSSYSRIGLMKAVYVVSSDFLSSLNFRVLIMFILFGAFSFYTIDVISP